MTTRAAGMLLAACAALFAACDLNPQPLPPGEQADAAADSPGFGGSSSSGGGGNAGGDGGTTTNDAGEREDARPSGDDGGMPTGDSGVDAADGAAPDAAPADAGDASLD